MNPAQPGPGMFASKKTILLALPSDVVDRARVLAGQATIELKLSVSLQIVLRALIEEALNQGDTPALLANFERQARMVRDVRRAARERARSQARPDAPPRSSRRQKPRRRNATRARARSGA